jgi:DNA mismatch endonuclease Vsr
MTDRLTPERRSALMKAVPTRNTSPELMVRALLWRSGFRYRLHRRDLPGTPDLVFPGKRKVIFVNGCFWHRHEGCSKGNPGLPRDRRDFLGTGLPVPVRPSKQYRPDVPAIYLAQKNRRAFDPPGLTYQLGNRHLNERGANIFPLSTTGEPLPGQIESRPNLTYAASMYATNTHADPAHIFFHALSTMHTPKYIRDNSGALMSDWPRIPLPATAFLLTRSANLGRQLAGLLDAESEVKLLSEWYFLGRLVVPKPPNLSENLKLTAGWGYHGREGTVNPGRGDIRPRQWSETELERLSTLAILHSISIDQVVSLLGETV